MGPFISTCSVSSSYPSTERQGTPLILTPHRLKGDDVVCLRCQWNLTSSVSHTRGRKAAYRAPKCWGVPPPACVTAPPPPASDHVSPRPFHEAVGFFSVFVF